MFDLVSFFDDRYTIDSVDGSTLIQLPLPGVAKEDLEIDSYNSTLDIKIKADKKLPFVQKRKWRFTHRLGTPQISAKVENGVLTVQLSEVSREKTRVEVS